jgi:hypothetical protein
MNKKRKPKEFVSTREWGRLLSPSISPRRVQKLYKEGRIKGAFKIGKSIFIPKDAPDPRKPRGRPALSPDNIRFIS